MCIFSSSLLSPHFNALNQFSIYLINSWVANNQDNNAHTQNRYAVFCCSSHSFSLHTMLWIMNSWKGIEFGWFYMLTIYLVLLPIPMLFFCLHFGLGFMFQLNSCESHSEKIPLFVFNLGIYAKTKTKKIKCDIFFESNRNVFVVEMLMHVRHNNINTNWFHKSIHSFAGNFIFARAS